MTRHFPFEGDDAAYIQFLEARILQLEDSIYHSSQQHNYIGTSSRSQADLNGLGNQGGAFAISHRNICQIQNASEDQSHDGDTQLASKDIYEHLHIRNGGHDPAALSIIEYKPPDPDETIKGARDQSKKHQTKMLSEFASFLEDLPRSEIWKNWVSALDDSQREKALNSLVQNCGLDASDASDASSIASQGTPKELADVSSKSTDIMVLSKYADFMILFGTVSHQLSCFQNIVFVSLCAVAMEIVEDKDSVYAVMRRVIGTDASSKYLLKLVRGAKWANRLVSLLSETKWASRSWDILCVAEHPVSFYSTLNDHSVSPKEVLERVKTFDHGDSLSESTSSPAPFAIPLIIKRIFDGNVSLNKICRYLGYELSSVKAYQTPFNSALECHSARKRPASTQFKPSKRHCPDNYASPSDNDGQGSQFYTPRVTNNLGSGPQPTEEISSMPALASIGILELAPAQGIQSNSGDAWTDSVAISAGDVSTGCPLMNYIPQPDASDSWANSAEMEAVYFPSDHTFINDIPQPNASDAWANSAGVGAVYFPSDHTFINDIPQPNASDAWANSSTQMLEDVSLSSYIGNDFGSTVGLIDGPTGDSESTTQYHSIAFGRNATNVTPVPRSARIARANGIAQPPVNVNSASPALRCSSLQSLGLRKEPERGQYPRSLAVN